MHRAHAVGLGVELDLDVALQGQRGGHREAVAHDGVERGQRRRRGVGLGAGAFQREQLVHEVGGARDALAQPRAHLGVALRPARRGRVLQQVGVELDRGERRLQLVRGVGQELALVLDALAQPRHQVVDGRDERRELAVLRSRPAA